MFPKGELPERARVPNVLGPNTKGKVMLRCAVAFLALAAVELVTIAACAEETVFHCTISVPVATEFKTESTITIDTSQSRYREVHPQGIDSGWVQVTIAGDKLTYDSDEYSFYFDIGTGRGEYEDQFGRSFYTCAR
jgi:hypothetical protein